MHGTLGREARIRELEDEVERYRQASEDALQQLDWCIGYLHGSAQDRDSEKGSRATVPTSAHTS